MSRDFPALTEMCEQPPRILNLHLGQRNQDKLAAVNIKVIPGKVQTSTAGYDAGHFTVVRSAGITDDLQGREILALLKEWKRILHRFGLLYLDIPIEQIHRTSSLLRKAGFSVVKPLPAGKDLPELCGYGGRDDSRLTLFAYRKKVPHSYRPRLSEASFRMRCRRFRETARNPAASFIIPVYNEEASLPRFLDSLQSCSNMTGTRREFIFVLNGCTDRSEHIIRDFIETTDLDCRIITSGKGVMTAIPAGINARTLDGFIGNLDADVEMDSQALDLMQMHLVNNPHVMVTYAEPVPRGEASPYNIIDFRPEIISKRLFFVGQTCLFRSMPLSRPAIARMLPKLNSNDMLHSIYFVYFYGLDSVAQTPHAITYFKPFTGMDGLVVNVSRIGSEADRLFSLYPPFAFLRGVFRREIYDPAYQRLYEEARQQAYHVGDWARIESTKG